MAGAWMNQLYAGLQGPLAPDVLGGQPYDAGAPPAGPPPGPIASVMPPAGMSQAQPYSALDEVAALQAAADAKAAKDMSVVPPPTAPAPVGIDTRSIQGVTGGETGVATNVPINTPPGEASGGGDATPDLSLLVPKFYKVSSGGYRPAGELDTETKTQSALRSQAAEFAQSAEGRGVDEAKEHGARAKQIGVESAAWEQMLQAQHEKDQAARAVELEAKSKAIDADVDRLSKDKVDPDGWWKSRTGGQKVAAGIAAIFGALGGSQHATDFIERETERHVRAQEATHRMGLDALQGKRNAYSLLYDKYQNAPAAKALASASAYKAAASLLDAEAAQYKGTQTEVDALKARDVIAAKALEQRAQAFKYIAAQSAGARYAAPGVVGTFSEAEAQRQQLGERGLGFAQGIAKDALKAEYDRQTEQAKTEGKRGEDVDKRRFTTPNGQTFLARRPEEAERLSKAAASVRNVERLMDEAKSVHNQLYTVKEGTINPAKRAVLNQRLDRIEADVVLEEKTQSELGVLAGPDLGIVAGVRGNLRSPITAKAHDAANSYRERVNQKLDDHIRSLPGVSQEATGTNQTPKSATKGWAPEKKGP